MDFKVLSLSINTEAFHITTSKRKHFKAKAVIIAGGVGSFQPVRLKVAGIESFEDKSLHYKVKNPEDFYNKDLVILGGGDSALDWALNLYDKTNSLLLIHRSENFRAAPASIIKMHQLCDNWEMQFIQGTVTGFRTKNEQLQQLEVTSQDGITRRVELEQLLVFFGLSPKLGPIASWGLNLCKNQIEVDTEKFQTNIPGIYAVGDINHYPGKKKLILSGFHEAALAAFAIKASLNPGKKVHLQYTTTSPVMHKRLGINSIDNN